MPLTDIAIRKAKPRAISYKIFDGGGLYLEIAPSGGKWWRYKYRFDGKEKRLSLGTYRDVSLKEVRIKHREVRKLLANDIDPSENRKAKKAARQEQSTNSFEIVAREWFIGREPNWKKNHSSKILARFENDIFPWLGKYPVSEITAPELLTTIRRIENRGALETAHRVLANCGQVFRAMP